MRSRDSAKQEADEAGVGVTRCCLSANCFFFYKQKKHSPK